MTDLAATVRQYKSSFESSLYGVNTWLVFGGISFIYLFFSWYLQTEVLTDQVYYYSLGSQVDGARLSAFLDSQHRMGWLSYIMLPIILLAKATVVSFCLLTGLLLTSRKLSFNILFRVVLCAESAFAVGTLLRLLLLTFFTSVQSLGQYASFAPLSLYSLLTPSSVPAWLVYPLQSLDIFQAAYVLLLSAGLEHYCRESYKKMLYLVLSSYGIGLVCCMIAIAFLTFSYH